MDNDQTQHDPDWWMDLLTEEYDEQIAGRQNAESREMVLEFDQRSAAGLSRIKAPLPRIQMGNDAA
ncbi:MAG: hypothetical protein N2C14_30290 [Planctomycetales bacterium]